MAEYNIENFPTSEAAKRMMVTISEDFYRDSYVMKWIQQVMGLEWDSAKKIIEEELPKQFYPETATWGLLFHEIKWHLPIRENLSYKERRKLIYQKRDFKGPMTPYKMEEYLSKTMDAKVHVMDCHDSGEQEYVPSHPNAFKVIFDKNDAVDFREAFKKIANIKQSHTILERMELLSDSIGNICPVIGMATVWRGEVTIMQEQEELLNGEME